MAGTGLIEAYLEQLRRELPRGSDTDDVIAEVEDHLRTIVEAHLDLGLSEEAATRHAVGAFGSTDLVARAFATNKETRSPCPPPSPPTPAPRPSSAASSSASR